MKSELFDKVDDMNTEYIDFLGDICTFEADAKDKAEIDKMVDFISEYALSKGFTVTRTKFADCGDFLTVDLNEGQEKGSLFRIRVCTKVYPCASDGKEAVYDPSRTDTARRGAEAFSPGLQSRPE